MEKKISKNKEKKQILVTQIVERALKAKAVVLTNYQGLTHKQLEDFRKALRNVNAEYLVTKNTLLKRAFEEANLEKGDRKNFYQPTATLFLYDDIAAPLKALAKMIKELQKPEIKYGILERKGITSSQVIKLAALPSREVLIAQLLGEMKAPVAGLHRSLIWNIQKFVMTLSAIEAQKA